MMAPDGLICTRCARAYPLTAFERACEDCAADGVIANLTVQYADAPAPARAAIPDEPRSLWRFAASLPLDAEDAVTLGEGMTPLVATDGLGHDRLLVKDESRNPTWSFKDRLATVAVSWARRTGATVIATSSSGNAGAAAAAYAARAGLPCVVLTFKGTAPAMVSQMRGYGAMVLELPGKDDRWTVLSRAVRELGWFPTSPFFGPTAGSNPIGIEGYKTLAYEIAEQLDWRTPEWCALPVCYGDALYGMWKGFEEMRRWGWTETVPRMIAAEVSGSLSAALEQSAQMPPAVPRNAASRAVSIDVVQGTFQALAALEASQGTAVNLDDQALADWQARLATTTGLSAELSSAASFAAIDRLHEAGTIKSGETVVAVMTASGLKDLGFDTGRAEGAPTATPDLDSVLRALHDGYGYVG